jgi:ATP-binding cassette subfamily B (MDR/TAP) protein 1
LAEQITSDLKAKYLKALLSQEVAYYEKSKIEYDPNNIEIFFKSIQTGIGESLGQLLQAIGTFIGGIAIAFIRGPVYAMACTAAVPFMLIFIYLVSSANKKASFRHAMKVKALNNYT